ETESLDIGWLKLLNGVFIALLLAFFGIYLLTRMDAFPSLSYPHALTNSGLIIAFVYISFKGVGQYVIADYHNIKLEETEDLVQKEKYATSSLSLEESTRLFREVVKLFNEQEVYLEPQLTIHQLSEQMGTTTHALSQAINSQFGKSFFDLVNEYRVNHVKRLLVDPDKQAFTFLALALESGFNSKSSFNRVFKQHTGMTPSEFQKAHAVV
ncbi:MAG: helix-turn-helix transcriptional regulator, partial [Bacteroidota bacterium]